MTDKEQSIADKTRDFFNTKLDGGYPVPTDKPTANIFVKEAMSTLGLKSGNRTKTKEILKDVLDARKIDTNTMGFSKNVSEKFHFVKEEIPEPQPQPTKTPEPQPQPSQDTILPKSEPIEKPKEPLPEIYKQRYHRDIGSISKWIHSMTVKHGIRKEEQHGQKSEIIQLGEDWADYLYESGIKLPKALGFTFLMLRTLVDVIFPIFKFMFRGKKQKEQQQKQEQKQN